MENNYLDILTKLKNPTQKSLSDENVLWICQNIAKYRPKRILEIGTSVGGSTAVYLNCIKSLNLDTEVVSLDSESICLYKKGKPAIGAEVLELKEYLKNVRYELITGKYLPQVTDDIGVFDMVIMDTVHFVPGEILDVLCLKKNIDEKTVLLLDDINIECRYPDLYPENLKGVSCNPIILASLKGELLLPDNLLPQIGGIELAKNPIDEERLLLGLCHKWNTDLEDSKDIYFDKIEEYYGNKYIKRLEKVYDKYRFSNFN